jgi:hypothetical protein
MILLMQHAATTLRLLAPRANLLGTGDSDSLQNVDTTELPNGALCWVNANATLYRLDSLSVAASAPDAIIVPASGPGRWIALSINALIEHMSMFSPDELSVLIGEADVWQALPVSIDYAPQVGGSTFWSISATTGVATYSGPLQIYHFTAAVNIAVDDVSSNVVEMALTVNGEDIGTSNARGLAERVETSSLTDFTVLALANEIALAPGDTVQLIVRNTSGETNLVLKGVQIIGIPVGPASETPAPPIVEFVDLGTAADFVMLGKTGITNISVSNITGDIGVSPAAAASITGFGLVLDGGGQFSTSAEITGQVYAADYAVPTPAKMTLAISDMEAAYTDAAGRVADFNEVAGGLIGGLTLTPGVYKWTTAVTIASNLTLSGGPTDVFILQTTGVLTLAVATSILLVGGVLPENVIWQVAGNAALNATSHFEGVLLCFTDISLGAGATGTARLLAQTAVNLNSDTITEP